ncbi:MAG: hypothetical protein K2K43_05755 [Alistipes sp.]|nr:hypothetical protein [Alistipes sp.]
MMKKGLIALLLVLPLSLTACLDGDSTPDPMQPGYNIYNVASLQKNLALIPADAGIRLAMLLAEADKLGLSNGENMYLPVEGHDQMISLKEQLFSNDTSITEEGTQYRIEYKHGYTNESYDGAIVVETGGRLLSATDADNAWEISATGFKIYFRGTLAYEYEEVPVRIYREGSAYEIEVVYSRIRYAGGGNLTSNCSGRFTFTATNPSLAYSDCHVDNADYKLNGYLAGRSFSSLNTEGKATDVRYEAENLRYKQQNGSMRVNSGTEKCSLTGIFDYDHAYYPSTTVEVVYTNGQATVSYNGQLR